MRSFLIAAAGVVAATGGLSAVNVTPAEAQAQMRGAPRGSYAESCTGSYVNQGRLYADCRDRRGNMRETSIELARCSSSDIGNDNGLRVCHTHRGDYEDNGRPGGNNGGGWGGNNGRNGITVYSDSNYRGQSQSFRSEIGDLGRSGLNDQISSIEVNGAWEVCTDAWFRGQCQFITSSTRNLNNTGINDRISSMRPARRGGGW